MSAFASAMAGVITQQQQQEEEEEEEEANGCEPQMCAAVLNCMFEFPPSKPPQPAAKGHSLSIDDEQAQKEEEEEMPTRSAWSAVVFEKEKEKIPRRTSRLVEFSFWKFEIRVKKRRAASVPLMVCCVPGCARLSLTL
ncbi:hypothetical protein OUZ56_031115 [Daphnia magna]|uniref:Uncharacterized protein n=1 Tax=Daphnia magna TaxID=35525 RepID=A0ABQ9ZTA7_9CRUS|nr:hypothetical protein OUZ56_031115 [Daphnia magna]